MDYDPDFVLDYLTAVIYCILIYLVSLLTLVVAFIFFRASTVYQITQQNHSNIRRHFENIACDGTEADLDACKSVQYNTACSGGNAVGITCCEYIISFYSYENNGTLNTVNGSWNIPFYWIYCCVTPRWKQILLDSNTLKKLFQTNKMCISDSVLFCLFGGKNLFDSFFIGNNSNTLFQFTLKPSPNIWLTQSLFSV